MRPVNFPEANKVLKAPQGMDNCDDMFVFGDGKCNVSCWELSQEEIETVAKTGKMWVIAYSGLSSPPIALTPNCPLVTVQTSEVSRVIE